MVTASIWSYGNLPVKILRTGEMPMSSRIDLRPDDDAKARLDRAAAKLGLSLSSFVLSAALEKAQDILARERLVLSDRDRDRLMALLRRRATPNAAMKRAIKRYGELIVSSED